MHKFVNTNFLISILYILLLTSCSEDNDQFFFQKSVIGLFLLLSLIIGIPLLMGLSWIFLTGKDSSDTDRLKGFLGLVAFGFFFFLIYKSCK
jgi:hypothetical protein